MAGDFLNVEDLDEDTLNQILGLGTMDDKSKLLEGQLGRAQALRDKSQAGPQARQYAGVYTAANPLEFAVDAYQGIKAGKDIDKLTEKQQALLDEQIKGRKAYFDALINRQRQGLTPAATNDPMQRAYREGEIV